jgi:hypothetical protein
MCWCLLESCQVFLAECYRSDRTTRSLWRRGEAEGFVTDEVTWHCLVLVYTFLYCAMTASILCLNFRHLFMSCSRTQRNDKRSPPPTGGLYSEP